MSIFKNFLLGSKMAEHIIFNRIRIMKKKYYSHQKNGNNINKTDRSCIGNSTKLITKLRRATLVAKLATSRQEAWVRISNVIMK